MPLLRLTLFLPLAALLHAQQPAADLLAGAAWRTREVAAGVTWRQARFAALFGGPQQVSVLAIDTRDGEARLRVAAPVSGLARTSALAGAHGAVAAVNGGFFAKDGRADDLLVVAGETRQPAVGRRAAALTVHADGTVRLTPLGRGAAPLPAEASPVHDALAAGPWLLRQGRITVQPAGPRHPRTAVGMAGDVLVFVTVDGRAEQALGMTLHELAQLVQALGCRAAFNLDGGGSTTMWVRSLGGVVNCPCDDKRFDPAGERAVGNAVLVLGRPIWTLDEDAATLLPPAAFAACRDPAAIDGDCAVATAAGSAVFDLAEAGSIDVVVEVFTRAGDRLAWSLQDHDGVVSARASGWCTLGEFAWVPGQQRRLTLRAAQSCTIDAVRVVQAHD